MRRLGILLVLILMMVLCVAPISAQDSRAFTQYTLSNADFPNPERGFYAQEGGLWLNDEQSPHSLQRLQHLRDTQNLSVLRWYLLIDELVEVDTIPQATLDYIDGQFEVARQAGFKVIPRVAYNFPMGGEYPYTEPDATLERTLSHVAQLEPLLVANADVIAFMEIGLVGAWGEWHSSTNGHVDPETGINDNSRAIVAALLDALPASRMIAMRYAPYKRQFYGDAPLTYEQAFSGSPQARMGQHNDCFLASATDWGSYPQNAQERAELRQFIHIDNQYVPQGGETCNDGADAQPYIGCDNAVSDLELLRFSVLNISYHEGVLNRWRNDGCFDEIAKRLGYRLHLTESSISTQALVGETLNLTLRLKNVGVTSPYNPRGFEIVLRSHADGALYRPTLTNTPDPRRWLPDLGIITLDVQAALASDLPSGTYDVLLNLPDPEPTLYGRPEYSIRLATQGVWEAETGFNDLGVDVTVLGAGAGVPTDLLINGGFEDSLTAWTVTRPAGKPDNDIVMCGGLGAGESACAFMFKGGAGERTRLTQTVVLTEGQLSAADTLLVSLSYSARLLTNRLSVKITAQPIGGAAEVVMGLPAGQFTRTTTLKTAPVYDTRLRTLPATLYDTPLESLTVQVTYKGTSGKVYLDDVRLRVNATATQDDRLPLPPSG